MRRGLALTLTLLWGCAGAGEASTDLDTGSGVDVAERDTGARADAETGDDDTEAVAEDSAEASDTSPPEDTVPSDTTPASCDGGLQGECEPSSLACDPAQGGIVVCGRCGNVVRVDACVDGQTCDPGADACRACAAGECATEAECPPNTSLCEDYHTAIHCNGAGEVDLTTPCAGQGRCIDGGCSTSGAATGSSCDADSACLGRSCLCDAAERDSAMAGCSTPLLASGFCTTSNCVRNGCDPVRERCADFSVTGAAGGDAVCISAGPCVAGSLTAACGSNGRCTEVPTRTTLGARATWTEACWSNTVKPIGAECSSDDDCIGGLCRHRTIEGFDVSYCTARCGEDAGCPSYATCADDPDTTRSNEFVCLVKSETCTHYGDDGFRLPSEPRSRMETAYRPAAFYSPADMASTSTVCYFPP